MAPRGHNHTLRFHPSEWSLVLYYSRKYNKSASEVVRSMIMAYVDADKRFDPDEFEDFIKKDLKKELSGEDDQWEYAELKKYGLEYKKRRDDSEAPTITSKRVK